MYCLPILFTEFQISNKYLVIYRSTSVRYCLGQKKWTLSRYEIYTRLKEREREIN